MTTDDLRDELAREMGWAYGRCPKGRGFDDHTDPCWWKEPESGAATVLFYGHPIPATRDGAAAAMPEGWRWERISEFGEYWWHAYRNVNEPPFVVHVPDTGCEIHDRLALALAARRAEKGQR